MTTIANRGFCNSLYSIRKLHLMKGRQEKTILTSSSKKSDQKEAISLNNNGEILLRIRAKPGAKQSAITDVGQDEIVVAIAAPAREGEANQELLQSMTRFLGIKKSEIEFGKGSKSRSKMLVLSAALKLNVEDVRKKLLQQIS